MIYSYGCHILWLLDTIAQKIGFPSGSDGKESDCNAGPWVQSLGQEDLLGSGKPTPVFLPEKFHGQRSQVG